MALQRPEHLAHRQVVGRAFGEDATIVTVTTTVNDFGEPIQAEATQAITCATAPPSAGDPRIRALFEGGVALEAMRLFWMVDTPRAAVDGENGSAGDIIVFARERFRVHSVAPWGRFYEVLGVRIEGQ